MLRIAICNESAVYGEMIEKVVCEWSLQRQLNIQIRRFVTGEEILADIEQTGYFNIVLMDTGLRGNISGIDTAEKIRQIYEYFCLIFVSGEDKYYKEVLRLHPFQYLEKPISKRKLLDSLNQAVDKYQLIHETFSFRFKGTAYCVRLSEVLYFASDKRIIRICMEDGREYVFYGKLDELEEEIQKYTSRFFRVHQSFLVNGRQIEQYHSRFVIMRKGHRIPISTERKGYAAEIGVKNYNFGC